MPGKYWWIKERYNPQFKTPYYVPYGQITTREARLMEKPGYGYNKMLKFSTREEYETKIKELKDTGFSVQG